MYMCHRGGASSPASPVLAGLLFLKLKIIFHFYIKQVINKTTSVIFVLLRLIILSCNR